MPRVLRLAIPDGVYHVTNRGLDRNAIVRGGRRIAGTGTANLTVPPRAVVGACSLMR